MAHVAHSGEPTGSGASEWGKLARRVLYAGVAAFVIGSLVIVNLRAYRPGTRETVRAQLTFLEHALEGGAADPAFAREQYDTLRGAFVDRRAGFPGVREYPHGEDGEGDVDSGPVLLGFSGPAVVVGAGAAAPGRRRVHRMGLVVRAAARRLTWC